MNTIDDLASACGMDRDACKKLIQACADNPDAWGALCHRVNLTRHQGRELHDDLAREYRVKRGLRQAAPPPPPEEEDDDEASEDEGTVAQPEAAPLRQGGRR